MSGRFPWGRFAMASTGLMGIGYIIMKATVPSEEELYNKMSPDLRKKVDAARTARLAREAEMTQQITAQTQRTPASNPDASKPIWADPPSSK